VHNTLGITGGVNGGSGGGINSSAWYEMINQTSGFCLDAAGWAPPTAPSCSNGLAAASYNQEWQFRPAATGGYDAVYNRNAPALVWDNSNGSTANGSPVRLWTYGSGNSNQEWQPQSLGNGLWRLVNQTSGFCLDNTGSTANGVQMTQWQCGSGNPNQEFTLVQEPLRRLERFRSWNGIGRI
jgi:glucosylceramidase